MKLARPATTATDITTAPTPAKPPIVTVGVSDARASANAAAVIATYSLGSCIGVCAYDATARVAGLLHFQLPTGSLDPARAAECPAMFADTGFDLLMRAVERLGGLPARCRVRLVGGAQILDDNNTFDIGRRNHTAIRKVLWKKGLFVHGEAVGGNTARTVYLHVADGRLVIKSNGTTTEL